MKKNLFFTQKKLGLIIAGIVMIALGGWFFRPHATPMPKDNQVIPVTVNLSAVGKAYPYSTVAIRSQVEGPIVNIGFQPGDDIKIGDILFKIDPRPFEVALQQAQASLSREQALLTKAQADSHRNKTLLEKKYVSQESYDQIYSAMLAQEASVRGAEASVAHAQLQLDYCTIHSPIEGQAGDILVNLGNLVKANDAEPLVIINQMHPMYVSFDVPEKFLPAIHRRMAAEKIFVAATDVNHQKIATAGELFFIDNTIDNLTGTIELKASFANENNELWPGQFVNVELGLYTIDQAILVPTRAIQQGQKGSYVFVINSDDRAEYRGIQTGEVIGNETIITEGLEANERVAIDGQFRLADGSAVQPQTEF